MVHLRPALDTWLLAQQTIDAEKGWGHWEGRFYDTGISVVALISFLEGCFPADPTLVQEAKTKVGAGLKWLAAGFYEDAKPKDTSSRSGMEVWALCEAKEYLSSADLNSQYGGIDVVLTRAIADYCLRMKKGSSNKDDETEEPFAEESRAIALSAALKSASDVLVPELVGEIKEMLLSGIERIEKRTDKDDRSC